MMILSRHINNKIPFSRLDVQSIVKEEQVQPPVGLTDLTEWSRKRRAQHKAEDEANPTVAPESRQRTQTVYQNILNEEDDAPESFDEEKGDPSDDEEESEDSPSEGDEDIDE
jgi:hypothetical protein